jgi:hypothetical protein
VKHCVNRIMAVQEKESFGRKAGGFSRAGCYICDGLEAGCTFYTPLEWVYDGPDAVPAAIIEIIRALEARAPRPAGEAPPTDPAG